MKFSFAVFTLLQKKKKKWDTREAHGSSLLEQDNLSECNWYVATELHFCVVYISLGYKVRSESAFPMAHSVLCKQPILGNHSYTEFSSVTCHY